MEIERRVLFERAAISGGFWGVCVGLELGYELVGGCCNSDKAWPFREPDTGREKFARGVEERG